MGPGEGVRIANFLCPGNYAVSGGVKGCEVVESIAKPDFKVPFGPAPGLTVETMIKLSHWSRRPSHVYRTLSQHAHMACPGLPSRLRHRLWLHISATVTSSRACRDRHDRRG